MPKPARYLVAAGGVLIAAPALAQEQTPPTPEMTVSVEAPTDPDEEAQTATNRAENVIIITARRRQEAAQDVPIAIATLDGRTINDTGAFSVAKIQQLAPTLQVYSSNPRNTAVNIRGLGVPFGLTNDGTEQGVGIYVDDVYYSRPASAVFDFLDVEQVEVLRGPQGTLYGKNTTAGAIAIRTNRPSFDFEGSAEATIGNLGFRQFKGAVSGPLSDTLAARLAVASTDRRGTLYNVTTDRFINQQDNRGVRGQLLWRPNDDLDVTLAADYNRQNPLCCGTVFVGYGPTQRGAARQYPALAAALGYTPASTHTFDRLTDLDAELGAGNTIGGASLKAEWELGAGTLTSITAWRFWDWDPANDRDFTGLDVVRTSQNPSQQDQYTQELRYGYSGRAINFVAGAFAFRQRIDTQGTETQGADASRFNLTGALAGNPAVLEGLTARNTQWLEATSLALFGQLEWQVSDRFSLQPGLRLNYDKKIGHYERQVFDGQGVAVPASGGTAVQQAQRGIYAPQLIEPRFADWNVSYDLTASYKIMDDVLFYGTYAKTFKTGGINLNGVPADAAGNPILAAGAIRPESVQHLETGVKTQFWDRRVTANLAAFRTTIDDFQANVSNGQFGVLRGYLANAERVRSQGFELDFSIRPSDRFKAYVNGAYTDAQYVRFTDAPCTPELLGGTTVGAGQVPSAPGTPGGLSPANCDVSGQVLPGVSRWSFSFGGEANAPATLFGQAGEVYAGIDGNYRSRFSSNPSPSIYTWIDGYAVANLRAGFRTDAGLNAYVWLRNAFDAEYLDQLTFGPGNTGLIAGNPGDPRTYGMTVRVEF